MNLRVITVAAVAGCLATLTFGADATGKKPEEVRINLDEPTAPTASTPVTKTTPTGARPVTAPTAKAKETTPTKAVAPKADAKKKAGKPKTEGLEIARSGGGYLGVKVDGSTFKVLFYDKDRKPVTADVARIALRWPVKYQPNDERTLLTPTGDGKAMASEKVVRPPLSFKLYLTLLKDGPAGEDVVAESYVVDFRQ